MRTAPVLRHQIPWKKHLGQLIANVKAQLHESRGDRALVTHDGARRATTATLCSCG
ncbi:hypothetical protein AB0A98_06390 [Streptomyces chrestomyceticus]|uniref:hypothetical protein n=1 Tax=Streptomyces chrestomyceticus TaxID=68185 RepID=UPI0033DB549B